jgi:hypothetical protein
MDTESEIDIIIECKKKMEQISTRDQSPDYSFIYQLMQQFTRLYCKHDIESDLIDIDPDRSKIIYYCTKCGEMLNL